MSLSTLEAWAYWTGVLAVVLTAAAAALGTVAWFFSNWRATEKDAALAEFQEDSRKTAAALQAQTAEADKKAAEANERAAKAGEGTAKAPAEVAKANERAAEANAIAEKERLARLQLEARLAPRVLSDAAQRAISAALKPLGKFSVQIFMYSDTTEVTRIADNLAGSLSGADWAIAIARADGGIIVSGMVVAAAKGDAAALNAATRFVAELKQHGVDAALHSAAAEDIPGPGIAFGNTIPAPQIKILIGTK
jgi:hypothetical protein